jgi:hypothetical protein
MATRKTPEQLKAKYEEKRKALEAKFAQLRRDEREKQKDAVARIKHRLEVIGRRQQLDEARSSQSPRKADAQAKIVIGAITMNFFTDHPNGQMSKQRILDGLKAYPRVLKNAVLRQFGHFLLHPEEAQSQETKTR